MNDFRSCCDPCLRSGVTVFGRIGIDPPPVVTVLLKKDAAGVCVRLIDVCLGVVGIGDAISDEFENKSKGAG